MNQKTTNILLRKLVLLWILLVSTGMQLANAQCNWNTGSSYGTGTAGTTCIPVNTGSSLCHYFSEYATFNGLTVGQTYTINTTNTTTAVSSGPFTLGVYTAATSGTVPLASATSATFPMSVTFVATTTTVYTKNFKSGCISTGSDCNYFTLQCNSCATPATTNQPSTSSVAVGTAAVQVLRADIPACSAGDVTSLTFNTSGSTNAADISNAKVYYTSSTTFSASAQFGTTVVNPNGSFTVTGTQSLTSGTIGYFWLTYDVACGATVADVLDASITSYTFAGNAVSPGTPNPTGTRDIVAAAPTYNATTTTSVTLGTTNLTLGRVNITGDNCNNTVTSVKFNTATSPAGDITQARCYYTTGTTFNTDSLFGSPVVSPNGDITFNGSKTLATGTGNNFWLTYDIPCSAGTTAGVDSVVGTPVSITTNTGVLSVATPSTNAKKKVNAQAPAYTATTSTSVSVGTANLTLGRINISGDNCNATVTSVKFNTATSPAGDIAQARCYYTTGTTFNTDSLFGSPVVSPNGDITFNGSKALASGSGNNFWLTYDISCSSGTVAGVDSVVATPVSITTNGGVISVATPSTNAKKKVNAATAPAYTATTTTAVAVGTANLTLGRINITGDNCNATVTSVKFNTATSPAGDIALARCYYTTSTTFSTDSLFGSPVVSPNGDIIFNGSKALATGSGNYFWLTYDISCNAGTVAGVDSVIATPVSITTNGGTTSVATPSTNAKKKVNAATAPTYTATTTTSVAVGTTNLTLGRINITGDNCNATVTSVKLNTSTSTVADISQAKCYYTTGTTFNTDSLFGSPVVSPNGDITFNGSKTLATGSGNYFWLTYDISCSAGTVAGVDSVVATPVSITTNGGAITVATPSTNAKKGVIIATTISTLADGDWSSPSIWPCGIVPTSTANVSINHAVTVTTSGNMAGNVTIAAGKTLTIASGNLTMGPVNGGNKQLSVSGTLAITNGTLNVNGSVFLSNGCTFAMSGGNFNIDPNDGTSAGSVASGTSTFAIGSASSDLITSNVTGGNILINDPPYAGTGYSVIMYAGNAQPWGGSTIQFGGSTGTNATTVTTGFKVECYYNYYRLAFGNVIINGNAADRYVNDATYGMSAINNLTINSGSELRLVQGTFTSFAGNITNNGTLTLGASAVLRLEGIPTQLASTLPATNPQVISGTGVYRNSTTASTANFTGLLVNNTSAAGVTFANANSLLSGSNTGTVSGTLTMTAGKINVGSNALVLGTSASSTGTYTYTAGMIVGSFKRWVDPSTGSRAFDIGLGNVGRKVAINFTTAPTTGGSLTAKWNSAASGTNGLPLTEGGNTYTNTSANGYWTVSTGDGLTGGTYTVAMTLTGGSDAPDYSTVTIGKRNTSADPWALVGTAVAPTGSATNFTVSRTGVTGFSDFTLLLTSTPLPIKLATFTGRTAGTANILNWTTANEKDASHFEIMRSNDGNKFDVLDKVNAKNNFAGSKYEFVDNNPFDGRNYYRLNMVDVNGKAVYSDVVVLSVKSSAGLSVTASPNPVSQSLSLTINGKISGKASIQIVDITGKIVRKMNAASNNFDIDMSNLANGTYIIKYSDDSNSSVIKVTKN